jgi:hypothetical protein
MTAIEHLPGGVGLPAARGGAGVLPRAAGEVRERGILFSAPMVLAILAGRKTQTRRLVKLPGGGEVDGTPGRDPIVLWSMSHQPTGANAMTCPYGVRGDRLWVRETYGLDEEYNGMPPSVAPGDATVLFHADSRTRGGAQGPQPFTPGKKRPGIHMPRWASRITLEVTGVRVERLQDITEEDAKAEGIEPTILGESWSCMRKDGGAFDCFVDPSAEDRRELVAVVHQPARQMFDARHNFRVLWNGINGERADWDSNPWLWVVEFRVLPAAEHGGGA